MDHEWLILEALLGRRLGRHAPGLAIEPVDAPGRALGRYRFSLANPPADFDGFGGELLFAVRRAPQLERPVHQRIERLDGWLVASRVFLLPGGLRMVAGDILVDGSADQVDRFLAGPVLQALRPATGAQGGLAVAVTRLVHDDFAPQAWILPGPLAGQQPSPA